MKLVEEQILKPMELIRRYVHLFDKLRVQLKIPNRQPLLDYAFGSNNWEKTGALLKYNGEVKLVADCINIYQADENNYGQETVKPNGKYWEILEEGDLWVALYTKIPNWLREIGEQRKKEREIIMKRKYEIN